MCAREILDRMEFSDIVLLVQLHSNEWNHDAGVASKMLALNHISNALSPPPPRIHTPETFLVMIIHKVNSLFTKRVDRKFLFEIV